MSYAEIMRCGIVYVSAQQTRQHVVVVAITHQKALEATVAAGEAAGMVAAAKVAGARAAAATAMAEEEVG